MVSFRDYFGNLWRASPTVLTRSLPFRSSVADHDDDSDMFVLLQFVVYGTYFYILGAAFFGKAVYSMTRKGWKNCWRERYVRDDSLENESINQDSSTADQEQNNTRDNGVIWEKKNRPEQSRAEQGRAGQGRAELKKRQNYNKMFWTFQFVDLIFGQTKVKMVIVI